jgi:hypothetical protein
VRDALYAAALHLRDLGADGSEVLPPGAVIGANDTIALQKYYCGGYYKRPECALYARGVERHARRADKELLIRDVKRQIEVLKLKRAEILLGTKSIPRTPQTILPQDQIFQGAVPVSLAPSLRPQTPKPEKPTEVFEPLFITPTSIPVGILREQYSVTFVAQGGKPPYVWSIEGEWASPEKPTVLPPGLAFSSTGTFSGIPTAHGDSYYTLSVRDSLGSRAQTDITLKVTVPQMSSEMRIRAHDGITDYKPTILKRKNGELVIVFVSYGRDEQTGLFSMRSLDNGATWSAPVFIYGQVSRSEIAEDAQGNIVVFTKGSGYDEEQFVALVSRDGGATWGDLRPVGITRKGNDSADSILFARDGYYYVSYRIGDNDSSNIYSSVLIMRSKDLITWEAPVVPASDSATGDEFPTSLLQGKDGTLYLSYISRRLKSIVIAESQNGKEWAIKRTIPHEEPHHLNPSGLLIGGAPVFLYAEGCACGITFFSHLLGAYWSDASRFFAFSQGYIASDAVQLSDGTLAIVASDFGADVDRDVIFAKTKKLEPPKQ